MANRKEVWTTCPRGEGKKEFWLRCGTAFENRDGSWSIVLDALPINGRLIVRDEREKQPERDEHPPPRRARAAPPTRDEDDYRGGDDVPF